MKTKRSISFLAILIYILLGLTSCEKVGNEVPPIDDPIKITKYIVEATSDSNGTVTPEKLEVTSGANAKFNFQSAPGYKTSYILINGKKASDFTSGSTEYIHSNITSDSYLELVNEKDTSYPWMILDPRGWVEYTNEYLENDSTWTLNYSDRPWVEYYHPDSTKSALIDGELMVISGKWYIDQSTTPAILHEGIAKDFPDGVLSEIERLDNDYLVITTRNIPGSVYSTIRVTYRHPK